MTRKRKRRKMRWIKLVEERINVQNKVYMMKCYLISKLRNIQRIHQRHRLGIIVSPP